MNLWDVRSNVKRQTMDVALPVGTSGEAVEVEPAVDLWRSEVGSNIGFDERFPLGTVNTVQERLA